MFTKRLFLATGLALAAFSFAHADLITLIPTIDTPTGANANALAGPLFSSDLDSDPISGPGTGTATASKFGNTATHTYTTELDYSTSPAFFDSDYSGLFERSAVEGERASAESIYYFTPDSPVVYDILGFFSVSDGGGTTIPGNVELEVELLEFDHPFDPFGPPPTALFYNWQNSKSTIDETFTIGGTDGDFTNVLTGMPTGILDPAKFYRYRTLVTINAIDIDGSGPLLPTDGTASATGAQTILFSPAEPVPEPSAGLLLGLVATVTLRRRR